MSIQGRQDRKITIITMYRVPKSSITTTGPNTSFYYQWHHLRRQGHLKPDPRAQVLQDLSQFINAQSSEHHAMVIGMDANESYTDQHSSLYKWMTQRSLVDIHMALHDIPTTISTYN